MQCETCYRHWRDYCHNGYLSQLYNEMMQELMKKYVSDCDAHVHEQGFALLCERDRRVSTFDAMKKYFDCCDAMRDTRQLVTAHCEYEHACEWSDFTAWGDNIAKSVLEQNKEPEVLVTPEPPKKKQKVKTELTEEQKERFKKLNQAFWKNLEDC